MGWAPAWCASASGGWSRATGASRASASRRGTRAARGHDRRVLRVSMIPDEIVEQVRDSADLVGIIGEAVELKRTGADYRGPCPFHGGTHRNFAVIPKKGRYYCFVCHESGDVFSWLMKRLGMDYPTAVREVARRVGIVDPRARRARRARSARAAVRGGGGGAGLVHPAAARGGRRPRARGSISRAARCRSTPRLCTGSATRRRARPSWPPWRSSASSRRC